MVKILGGAELASFGYWGGFLPQTTPLLVLKKIPKTKALEESPHTLKHQRVTREMKAY